MKRLKAISNREWAERHKPEEVHKRFVGGVSGCPGDYELEIYKNCFRGLTPVEECAECWDMPAKRNGKYIMKVVIK